MRLEVGRTKKDLVLENRFAPRRVFPRPAHIGAVRVRDSAGGKESRRFASGVLIIEVVSTGKAVVLLILFAGIAAVAWQAGRKAERQAARGGESASLPVTAPITEEPAAPTPLPATEAEATFEVPIPAVADERPTAVPFAPPEERPSDTAARCVMLQAHPSTVAAYGRSGEVVQLVVRGQNGCATNFGYVSFRAIAIGPNGLELASAVGRFPEGIRAGGSAETLIVVPTKPDMGVTYRAEPQ